MDRKIEYSAEHLLLLLSALLAMVVLVLAVGGTWAHFEGVVEDYVPLRYESSDAQVYILGTEKDESGAYLTGESGELAVPAGWVAITESEQEAAAQGEATEESSAVTVSSTARYALDFMLTNAAKTTAHPDESLEVSLTLFVTVGAPDPEQLELTLYDGGNTYVAEATEVEAGSAWYDAYGAGWTYRFFTGAGEELAWTLAGGEFSCREMKMTVRCESGTAALVQFIVSAHPAE